ncbi:hypothetical protein [Microbacterium sp. Leaf159]|uniref:hypothetical protein n=1 Tax=Microbacterium sp. Leaf159 TaxID=1736279 RepID=UPI000700C688|nr:hypothetical protein [Microbacterium sp. Leaf159]KQR39476.1 hypothetical protein ASF80_08705 [Microbacterium sp. Leaf159]
MTQDSRGSGPRDAEDQPIFGSFAVGSEQDRKAREALRQLRESAQDDSMRRSVESVLNGRATIQQLFDSPEIKARMTALNERVQDEVRQMTPEQRAEMMKRFRPAEER